MLTITNSEGKTIRSIEDWRELAPPKGGDEQWVDFRSAKELAKAFFRKGYAEMPEELDQFLKEMCNETRYEVIEIIAEKKTKLDNYRGEGRNHDLCMLIRCNDELMTVCIEAKTDEGFSKLIKVKYNYVDKHPESNQVRRVEGLNESLIPLERQNSDELKSLRYQLFSATSGTLIEAKNQKSARAVFIVYELLFRGLNQNMLERNDEDLKRFLNYMGLNWETTNAYGKLSNESKVPGNSFVPSNIPLQIGKVVKRLDEDVADK